MDNLFVHPCWLKLEQKYPKIAVVVVTSKSWLAQEMKNFIVQTKLAKNYRAMQNTYNWKLKKKKE